MTTEVTTYQPSAPEPIAITEDQVALIRRTIAEGATDQELQLYFYDCRRRGVHPLDRMIHFTKRSGKYTPVTSIDFMRSRAHESGQCAGIDDAIFTGEPRTESFAATVTVHRIVQGQRCPFTATARWSEYYPKGSFTGMWDKMPHTMLAKCAEGLSLRKAFPAQLQGLYIVEEMDQAGQKEQTAPSGARTVPLENKKNGGTKPTADSHEAGDLRVKLTSAIAKLIQISGGEPAAILKTFSRFEIADKDSGKTKAFEARDLDHLLRPNAQGKLAWAESTLDRMLLEIDRLTSEQAIAQ